MWYGGGGDSALGDSVMSADDLSDPTSRQRGYSGDDDDDDVIPDVISEFQVDDVTRYFNSLQNQYHHKLGNAASAAAAAVSSLSCCFAYICFCFCFVGSCL